jgi:hypothetical protein
MPKIGPGLADIAVLVELTTQYWYRVTWAPILPHLDRFARLGAASRPRSPVRLVANSGAAGLFWGSTGAGLR